MNSKERRNIDVSSTRKQSSEKSRRQNPHLTDTVELMTVGPKPLSRFAVFMLLKMKGLEHSILSADIAMPYTGVQENHKLLGA